MEGGGFIVLLCHDRNDSCLKGSHRERTVLLVGQDEGRIGGASYFEYTNLYYFLNCYCSILSNGLLVRLQSLNRNAK